MPNTSLTPPELELKVYCEDEDFRAQGKLEPNRRSQTLIYHLREEKWWIKVTLKGSISFFSCSTQPGHIRSKRERRNEFQDFITMINFQSLVLLDDTVTELILNEDAETANATYMYLELKDTNEPKSLFKNIRYSIREDPLREIEVADGVFRVFHKGDETPYILKVVNRPFYHPRDTEVIQEELENLEHFRGVRGLVQPAGIAVFSNPYATSQEGNQHMVIKGILLEYYSGGSLQCVLEEQRVTDFGWERWAVQIGNALDTIHRVKKTQMDLKPSNIFLDKDGNAVLIGISGIGGITHKWQAPEIRDEISPLIFHFKHAD
ncbi:hypothetical protein N7478_005020 [Penicillium angulare]|uniref:uncharacterized protein n=1 Tax=Penicillium angulare TaxID=116970 RepID=UPI00253F9B8B|nr:uncharacterized protein N7478_005020 [Penicillium angulare]KAJ5279648.1 hypothetical protein N7478_005020 [Penicillium angulare]